MTIKATIVVKGLTDSFYYGDHVELADAIADFGHVYLGQGPITVVLTEVDDSITGFMALLDGDDDDYIDDADLADWERQLLGLDDDYAEEADVPTPEEVKELPKRRLFGSLFS